MYGTTGQVRLGLKAISQWKFLLLGSVAALVKYTAVE